MDVASVFLWLRSVPTGYSAAPGSATTKANSVACCCGSGRRGYNCGRRPSRRTHHGSSRFHSRKRASSSCRMRRLPRSDLFRYRRKWSAETGRTLQDNRQGRVPFVWRSNQNGHRGQLGPATESVEGQPSVADWPRGSSHRTGRRHRGRCGRPATASRQTPLEPHFPGCSLVARLSPRV